MKNLIKAFLLLVGIVFTLGSVGGLECETLSFGAAIVFEVSGIVILAFDYWLFHRWI